MIRSRTLRARKFASGPVSTLNQCHNCLCAGFLIRIPPKLQKLITHRPDLGQHIGSRHQPCSVPKEPIERQKPRDVILYIVFECAEPCTSLPFHTQARHSNVRLFALKSDHLTAFAYRGTMLICDLPLSSSRDARDHRWWGVEAMVGGGDCPGILAHCAQVQWEPLIPL
jgi:hypothetical protein